MCSHYEGHEVPPKDIRRKTPTNPFRKLWIRLKELMVGRYNITHEEYLHLYKE